MNIKVIIVVLSVGILLVLCSIASSSNHYIRDGATGVNDGSDWTNAWTDLPTTFVRGDTYYVAAGNYGTHIFPTLSGTSYVYLKKATVADHGTDAGWSDAYSTGQAVFSGVGTVWDIRMSYLVVDGVTGSGTSGHGIRLNSSSTTDGLGAIVVPNGATATNIILQHLEMNNADWGSGNASRVVYNWSSNGNDWTFQYCYIHGGRVWIAYLSAVNLLIEYCYFKNAGSGSGELHSAGFTLVNANQTTIRYNVFENMYATGSTTYIEPQGNSQNVYVYGNVFKGTDANEGTSQGIFAITSTDTCTNCLIYNNTAYNLSATASSGVWGGNVVGSSLVVRNNVWKSCTNVSIYDPGDNVTDSNNSLDASGVNFIDAVGGNFRLSSGTVTGYSLTSPYNTDPDGQARGNDGTWDIGAYEYDSGTTTVSKGASIIGGSLR